MHVGTPDLLFTCMVHPERELCSVASWMPRRSPTSVYAVSSEDDCVCVCDHQACDSANEGMVAVSGVASV